ncbi:MAG: hypothetical protein HDR13_07785 [Lachnospiraceae bacterium]|nr:hypothetical protein [Lachnospiraceae bacterium]
MGMIADTIGCIGAIAGGVVSSWLASATDTLRSGSSSDNYHPSASITAAHSKSNAVILAELKKDIRGKTEKAEEKIIDNINESLNKLLEELEQVNGQSFGDKTLNINIKEIKSKNEKLKKDVVGFIGNYMDDRLVLSDYELSKILQELDDGKRKREFDAFCKKLHRQAVTRLTSKIATTVHKQEEIVRKEIQNRLTEVEQNMQEATKAYEEIFRMKDAQDSAGIEEKQIKYCYQYELAEILLGQLES